MIVYADWITFYTQETINFFITWAASSFFLDNVSKRSRVERLAWLWPRRRDWEQTLGHWRGCGILTALWNRNWNCRFCGWGDCNRCRLGLHRVLICLAFFVRISAKVVKKRENTPANMLNRTDFSSIPTTLLSNCCLGWTKARLRPKICDQSPNSAENRIKLIFL